jgi:hypothetical protein
MAANSNELANLFEFSEIECEEKYGKFLARLASYYAAAEEHSVGHSEILRRKISLSNYFTV